MQKHNFSPGPATLPKEVFQQAADALIDFNHSGLSIAEISHRAPEFVQIIEEASALVRELYQLPDYFEVLWLPGGASSQLAMAPMNLLGLNESMAIVDTGFWAQRSIDAAREMANVHVLASSASTKYDRILKHWTLPAEARYLHVVSNETIEGIQYHDYPEVDIPLVADMTSDFLSKPLDIDRFGIIFASAQKNFGIAGITCVLVNTKVLTASNDCKIPNIWNYQTHIDNQSLYHTVPTFPVFVALLMLRWIKSQGGLLEMQRRSVEKSSLLYDEIDRNPLFEGIAVKADRSLLNACFRAISTEIEIQFLEYLSQHDVVGIKGFPTVGGFRASMYNGMSVASVQHLVQLMKNFKPSI
ncbi:MAG: 3-phosphoserine/phosphohydroxythreonine transaminase [Aquirufa sp.]